MQIEKCLLNGTPIDKIGLQHHIFTGVKARTAEQYEEEVSRPKLVDPLDHYKMLDLMAEFGLPLELTEVTVPTFCETEEDEELQAVLLEGLYSVWFSHPAVDSVVYWNQIDGYAYVSADPTEYWNENNCRGGLFRHDLTPKRSALALRRLIREVWHTEETAETDGDGRRRTETDGDDGQLTFSGFFGEYRLECAGGTADFGLHKGGENEYRITL